MIIQFLQRTLWSRQCFIKLSFGKAGAWPLGWRWFHHEYTSVASMSLVLGHMLSSSRKKIYMQFLCFKGRGLPKRRRCPWWRLWGLGWCLDWPLNHVYGHLGGGAWDRPILPAVTGVSPLLVVGWRADHVHAVLHPRGQVLPLSEGPVGRRRTE